MSDALTKLQAYGRLNGKNADMPGWLNIHPKFCKKTCKNTLMHKIGGISL